MIYNNILETVGHTPVVRLHRLAPPHVTLYAKIEARNPAGSVKDRIAVAMVQGARQSGRLLAGQTVVEATSGNTGIALAMVCAVHNHPFVAVMADSSSLERRLMIRHLGGRVVLVPAAAGTAHMVRVADQLAAHNGWYCPHQFDNPLNAHCHYRATGQEIITAFDGHKLDYFVCGYGTGGTFSGIGRRLRHDRPEVRLVAAEPARAPLLSGGCWQSHQIFGWAGDFIPAIMDSQLAHQVITVSDQEAITTAQRLAREEGLCCGISSGAAAAAALKIARIAAEGSVILTLFPDHGERYLSTGLLGQADEAPVYTEAPHAVTLAAHA